MTHKFQTTETIEVTSFPHYRKYAHFYYKSMQIFATILLLQTTHSEMVVMK